MFEFRTGSSRKAVSDLFGKGIHLTSKVYVEDPETGNLLIRSGGAGRDVDGGTYVLRWQGRTIGLEFTLVRHEDEHGFHYVFHLSELGTSEWTLAHAHVAKVELAPADAAAALRVAAEACVVYETHLNIYGSHPRVSDPAGTGRELSPADFGYGEIVSAWGSR